MDSASGVLAVNGFERARLMRCWYQQLCERRWWMGRWDPCLRGVLLGFMPIPSLMLTSRPLDWLEACKCDASNEDRHSRARGLAYDDLGGTSRCYDIYTHVWGKPPPQQSRDRYPARNSPLSALQRALRLQSPCSRLVTFSFLRHPPFPPSHPQVMNLCYFSRSSLSSVILSQWLQWDQIGEICWIVWLSKMEEDPSNIHDGLQLRWAEKGVETARIIAICGNKNIR